MNSAPSLSRSLRLVNSLWIPAGVFYYLRHAAFTKSLSVPSSLSRILDTVLSFIFLLIFLTWIWGTIVEILSGEENVPRFANFKANLRKCWWIAGTTFLLPWLIHFTLFMTTGVNDVSIEFITTAVSVIMAYWAAGQFIKIKYDSLLPSGKVTRAPSLLTIACGLIFPGLALGLYYCLTHAMLPTWAKPLVEIVSIQLYFLMFAFFADMNLRAHPPIAKHYTSAKTLVLVNLPSGDIVIEVISALLIRTYPTFFAVLRALTPVGYRVIEYNRMIWNDRYYHSNALVAISCFTSNCSDAYRIAREFRHRGSKVIIGGPHVTFFPDEALEFCDSVVIGPAESVWEEIVRDYEANSLKPVYHGSCPQDKSDRVHQYLMNAPVEIAANCLQASRGCKFDCYFCANPAITGRIRMEKTVDEMVALVKKVGQKKKLLYFLDNNLYADPAYAKKFMQALIPLKIMWAANVSIDIANDDEAMRLLKQSGCVAVLIGYEVEANSIESKRGGKFALAKDYIALTRKLSKAGIQVKAHFMFGFPGDTWRSLARLWWFCFRLSPAFTVVSFMTPLPGSRFFEDSVRNETIINPNWRAYDIYHQVIDLPHLGSNGLFRKAFTVVTVFFLVTTSSLGRLFLLCLIILEFLYFHAPA